MWSPCYKQLDQLGLSRSAWVLSRYSITSTESDDQQWRSYLQLWSSLTEDLSKSRPTQIHERLGLTYVGSEVLRSCEKDDDDGRADKQDAVRQGQRHHDDDGDQPRPVGRLLELHARRRAVVLSLRADGPERKGGEDEADEGQGDDDKSSATSCRQRGDLEWLNDCDQSFHGDRHRYPRRQQLATAQRTGLQSNVAKGRTANRRPDLLHTCYLSSLPRRMDLSTTQAWQAKYNEQCPPGSSISTLMRPVGAGSLMGLVTEKKLSVVI